MMVRELLISLAVTLLVGGLIFYYFKNRLSRTEQKVDLMFQLIQEHERSSQLREMGVPCAIRRNDATPPPVQSSEGKPQGLIQISDDEESDDGYSDGSSEESDTATKDGLEIGDSPLETNIKTISLSLSGAETGEQAKTDGNKGDIKLEDMGDLDEVSDLDDQTGVDGSQQTPDVDSTDPSSGGVTNTVIKLEEEDVDYSKMNMTTLKALAEERNLHNYKKLRKPKLVELLITSLQYVS